MRAGDPFGGISAGDSRASGCGGTSGSGDIVLFVEVEGVLDFVNGRHLEVLSMEFYLLI